MPHTVLVTDHDVSTVVPGPPSEAEIRRALRLIAPIRKVINPKVYGIENVPDRRALLVGNHTVMGMLDSPLMCAELWERGIVVRSLGDHAHFKIPIWRDILAGCGVVDGTRAITAELMRRGEVVLVYPGGGREVAKRKGEKYQLIWKNRMGFARLAIEHGYDIVPFAAVGAEEAVDILMDGDHPLLTPTRLFVEKVLGSPDAMPITRGIGITPFPRPERQYYWFGKPIQTASLAGQQADDAVVRRIRERTKKAVEAGIEFLLDEREKDPNRPVVKRLLGSERRS
ncbi:MAG: lysophospholipid acyltransferase family protein [Mycolicibacterium sp.]|uniref:lysophospholipid acyltransferase family protein n=1 Tax=Mycolicibacterium sp. TaxID=2320850 RepID=UPI003D112D94